MEGVIIFWFILCIVVGVIASNNGRSGVGYFILSILLSPLIGILVVLIVGKNLSAIDQQKIANGSDKKCPFCAELIKREAKVCRYCGRELEAGSVGHPEIADEKLMQRYGITFVDGKYVFGEYEYNDLKEALEYAERLNS